MLVIASDIHLGDGSCGKSISPSAFHLFNERLKELAFNASWRDDYTYRPLEQIDILLMGDILDPLHSSKWLEKELSEPDCVRPWTDHRQPGYAATLDSITESILTNNSEATAVLKSLSENGITIPAAAQHDQNSKNMDEQVVIKVHIYYMVGNHDWYYHLPGLEFDAIRKKIIDAMGLANAVGPFPHELHESPALMELLTSYQVYGQHGDLYDTFNYDKEAGRDSSTIGDAFAVEIINRFPLEARKYMKNDLPEDFLDNLRELVNVRPALATPLWISSQLRQNNISSAVQNKLKNLWDELGSEFLKLPIVRAADKPGKLDVVDGLQLAIKLTDRFSFKTIDDLVVWIRRKFWEEEITYSKHALKEAAFLNHSARFIVYGHTHHHEIVPLDSLPPAVHPTNQMYFNSGTWHTYFDLAVYKPQEQKFIPYQVLTYLTFFRDDECKGRHFETWSGAFSN